MSYMAAEIAEQPDVVARVAADLRPYRDACRGARGAGVRFVLFAARGTSDNAAVYGKYLASIRGGIPAGLAIPSAVTLYGAELALREALVVGISQSGRTPDVAEYLHRARRRGAFTIAITNDPGSPLAETAHAVLPTLAGEERAVPATKTYTSQLAVLALLWAAWSEDDALAATIRDEVPDALRTVLAEAAIADVAARLGGAGRLVVAARGYNFATALEIALKLKEVCYLDATPYSTADLVHGPIAVVDPSWHALLVAVPGPARESVVQVAGELRRRGVDVTLLTPAEDEAPADRVVPLPAGLPEELTPLVAVVPGQLLALHLARARGEDPDRPRGLSKVTRTR